MFLIAYEEEKEKTLKSVLKKLENKDQINIGILIGPEGGIEPKEVEYITQKGGISVTLGNRILRTETASIYIASNIMYELEE